MEIKPHGTLPGGVVLAGIDIDIYRYIYIYVLNRTQKYKVFALKK